MGIKNISERPDFKQITAKGGSRSSPKKQAAARLSQLKYWAGKGNQNSINKLLTMIDNRRYHALDVLNTLEVLESSNLTNNQKILVARLKIEALKVINPGELQVNHDFSWTDAVVQAYEESKKRNGEDNS